MSSVPFRGEAAGAAGQAPVRGVLFDVDGTLFDHAGAERAGILAWLRASGLPCDAAAAEAWAVATAANYARFLNGEISFEQQRLDRVRAFLGRALDDAAAREWFAGYFAEYQRRWRLFDDVPAALDALAKAAGIRLGIVSNSLAANQCLKLTTLGVLDRFDCVICSDDIGIAKPAPEIFQAGCEALGLAPSECCYVGDLPDVDAAGALAAGLRAVWLDRFAEAESLVGGVAAGIRVIALLDELSTVLDIG